MNGVKSLYTGSVLKCGGLVAFCVCGPVFRICMKGILWIRAEVYQRGAVGEGLGVYEYLAVPSIVLLYHGLGVKY